MFRDCEYTDPVAGRRLLVVEDDGNLRRTLVRCLVKEGCQVSEAGDGREAVAKLEAKHSFDLVISDLEMPHADGREVVAAGVRARVPVVILTGNSSVTAAVELMKKGAANFVTKPFTPASLRAVLDEMLGPTAPPQATAAVRPLIGTEAPLQRALADRGKPLLFAQLRDLPGVHWATEVVAL